MEGAPIAVVAAVVAVAVKDKRQRAGKRWARHPAALRAKARDLVRVC